MAIDFLSSYTSLGLNLEQANGNQYKADCPFTGKVGKFFVNIDNGLWDSKTAGLSGNLTSFMDQLYNEALKLTTPEDLVFVTDAKKIPVQGLIGQVAVNHLNNDLLIPCRRHDGRLLSVSRWYKGSTFVARIKNTKTGLTGVDLLKGNDHPVYVVEGEWDMFMLRWLHHRVDHKSVVVSVPGSNTFKPEWATHLEGRDVYLCYDNDKAGASGEEKAKTILTARARSIKYLQWHELHPDKFDVRDFILDTAVPLTNSKKVHKCFTIMDKMMSDKSRDERDNPDKYRQEAKKEEKRVLNVPSLDEVHDAYSKWLKMTSYDPLAFMFGTCFANRIQGDPVWSLIVAPPGGSKTELLMTLSNADIITTVTTITPAAMISGMRAEVDPSLIPKLNGKVLVIKDFTTILSMAPLNRDELFGILRDVYDGHIEKIFGNGIKRAYSSSFGILAGVTPAIDSFYSMNSSLGERFLKFRLDRSIFPEDEEQRLMKVMMNIDKESGMRDELKRIGERVLSMPLPKTLPEIKDTRIMNTIMKCARFTAKLRSSVNKDKFTKEITSMPTTEIATRLTKQLSKLAIGIAIYQRKDFVDEEVMQIIKQVARDTCPEIIEDIIYVIYNHTRHTSTATIDKPTIDKNCKTNETTAGKIIENMIMLGIVKKVRGAEGGFKTKQFFRLSTDMMHIIDDIKLYD